MLYYEMLEETLSQENPDTTQITEIILGWLEYMFSKSLSPIPFIDEVDTMYSNIYRKIEEIMEGRETLFKEYEAKNIILDISDKYTPIRIRFTWFISCKLPNLSLEEARKWIIAFLGLMEYEVSRVVESSNLNKEYAPIVLVEYLEKPIVALRNIAYDSIEYFRNKGEEASAINMEEAFRVVDEYIKEKSTPDIHYLAKIDKNTYNGHLVNYLFG